MLSVKQKKKPYSKKILNRWTVIKEIIGKVKRSKKSNFSRKLKIGNKIKTGEVKQKINLTNTLQILVYPQQKIFLIHRHYLKDF